MRAVKKELMYNYDVSSTDARLFSLRPSVAKLFASLFAPLLSAYGPVFRSFIVFFEK